jgi:hypothetical protein
MSGMFFKLMIANSRASVFHDIRGEMAESKSRTLSRRKDDSAFAMMVLMKQSSRKIIIKLSSKEVSW